MEGIDLPSLELIGIVFPQRDQHAVLRNGGDHTAGGHIGDVDYKIEDHQQNGNLRSQRQQPALYKLPEVEFFDGFLIHDGFLLSCPA